jgi:hypothetical protein
MKRGNGVPAGRMVSGPGTLARAGRSTSRVTVSPAAPNASTYSSRVR